MGQKHYSGSYWSSTQADHVIYESRLELARLLYADFDRDVTAIVAQPAPGIPLGGRHPRHNSRATPARAGRTFTPLTEFSRTCCPVLGSGVMPGGPGGPDLR